jgi:hypothetical protein
MSEKGGKSWVNKAYLYLRGICRNCLRKQATHMKEDPRPRAQSMIVLQGKTGKKERGANTIHKSRARAGRQLQLTNESSSFHSRWIHAWMGHTSTQEWMNQKSDAPKGIHPRNIYQALAILQP